jgi:2-polyprenyl-6-methoxyphenol hydroxylase-like FAD-dependent oxidoreductase
MASTATGPKVAIVGAGLTGLLAAHGLKKVRHVPDLPDSPRVHNNGGRHVP